jgi:very-short-patch-repair endonuclease
MAFGHREDLLEGLVRQTSRATVKKARGLRRVMTPPEVLLWQRLRGRPGGVKFRRQHPVGRYVADFYAPDARVIVEVDGLAHDARVERDAVRDDWLRGQGFVVVRVAAAEVLRDVDGVVAGLVAVVTSR